MGRSCGLQPYSYWQGIKRHSDLCVQSLLTLQLVPLLSVAGSKTANCAWRDQSLVAVAVAVLPLAVCSWGVKLFPRQLQDRLLKLKTYDDRRFRFLKFVCPPLAAAARTPSRRHGSTLSYIADGRLRHSVAWRNAPGVAVLCIVRI